MENSNKSLIIGIIVVVIIIIFLIIFLSYGRVCKTEKVNTYPTDDNATKLLVKIKNRVDEQSTLVRLYAIELLNNAPEEQTNTTFKCIMSNYQIINQYLALKSDKTDILDQLWKDKTLAIQKMIAEDSVVEEELRLINENIAKIMSEHCRGYEKLLSILKHLDIYINSQISNIKIGDYNRSVKGYTQYKNTMKEYFDYIGYLKIKCNAI